MAAVARVATVLVAAAAAAGAQRAGTPEELADMTECIAALGLKDLTPYQTDAFAVTSNYGAASSAPIFLPAYASAPLTTTSPNASITTALVVLHGLSGDANSYFCSALAAARARPDAGSVLVVAPWLGNEGVTGAWWAGASDGGQSLFWTVTRWTHGGNASPGPNGDDPPVKFSTSFDALDAVVDTLTSAATPNGVLPSLSLITLAGFSAGAQLAQRYAFARHVTTAAAGGANASSPHVRVLVSDPGSWLYLTDSRPAPACRPLSDTGPSWGCTTFEVPPEAGECADYDTWKYGVGAGLDDNLYVAPLDGDAAALAAQVAAYPGRDVRYLLGDGDACNCNSEGFANGPACVPPGASADQCTPDAYGGPGCCDTWPDSDTSNALDTTCASMVQGSNRLQRGLLYGAYLADAFPDSPPPMVATFTGGHNNSAFYASEAFAKWAYTL